jgi:hypothetical protein
VLSGTELAELVARVGPVLVFLLAITVVAEISDRAGVFDVAGHWAARAGRHRTLVLWLLFVLVAVACTVVLSLDTTAVLLTPVGLAVARQLGLSPVPFALSTLWLANTASLLLPVSNLTNLLAADRVALGAPAFAARGPRRGIRARTAVDDDAPARRRRKDPGQLGLPRARQRADAREVHRHGEAVGDDRVGGPHRPEEG